MLEFVQTLFTAHWVVWCAALVITMFGAWLVASQVGSWWLALFFLPGLLVGSLNFGRVLDAYNIRLTPDRDVDAVVDATLGAAAALMVMLVITKIIVVIHGFTIRAPYRNERRDGIVRSSIARNV